MKTDEILGEIKVNGLDKLPEALHLEADHEPTPELQGYPNPNGDGFVVPIKTGTDEWEIQALRGPQENSAGHHFDSIRGFVAWLKRWTERPEAAQVFASVGTSIMETDITGRKLQAGIDPRDPGGDFVTGNARLDPIFLAWISLKRNEVALNQRTFFTFIREFGSVIQGEGVADHLLASLAALRVTSTNNLEAEFAANGRLKVSGARGDVTISQDLPSEFEILVPVYSGVHWFSPLGADEALAVRSEYRIRVVLDVNAGVEFGGLRVEMSFPGIETVLADADEDLVNHIQHELGAGFLVCAGTAKSCSVPVREGRANRDSEFLGIVHD